MTTLKLKIYSNQTNKEIYNTFITPEILKEYNIDINSEEFQELFETEILFDIFEENNINSSNVYYEIIK